jgi:hypothetical protein
MNEFQRERARKLVDELRDAGIGCGLLFSSGVVVLRSPGSPYFDTPTYFDEADLKNAVELDLLNKGEAIGNNSWEWCVLKKRRI